MRSLPHPQETASIVDRIEQRIADGRHGTDGVEPLLPADDRSERTPDPVEPPD
jgi:hypothetical protein